MDTLKFIGLIITFYLIASLVYLILNLFIPVTFTDALISCLIADIVRTRMQLKKAGALDSLL